MKGSESKALRPAFPFIVSVVLLKINHWKSMSFTNYSLAKELLQALQQMGYENPTPVQQLVLTKILEHMKLKSAQAKHCDYIVQAQTGSGKTVAFGLPLLDKLHNLMIAGEVKKDSKDPLALILCPTRELAKQVEIELHKLASCLPAINTCAIFGGASYTDQIRKIKKERPMILVATPGRLMDLMEKKVVRLGDVKQVILDEADEMLNMGFMEEVQSILEHMDAEQRRIWMVSATMPKSIAKFIQATFQNPIYLKVEGETNDKSHIDQKYFLVQSRQHRQALLRLILQEPDFYGMVFCQTRNETMDLAQALSNEGLKAACLHGEMKQNERERMLEQFKHKRIRILVCTDVAARGIHVDDLEHVVNYGLPRDMETYVHRIGRTGRAGKKGTGYALVDPRDQDLLLRLKGQGKMKLEQGKLPEVANLRRQLALRELEKLGPILEKNQHRQRTENKDTTFDLLLEYFEDRSKEELIHLLYTWQFQNKLNGITNEDIREDFKLRAFQSRSRSSSYSSRRFGGGGRRSGGYGTGHGNGDGRRSGGAGRSGGGGRSGGRRFGSYDRGGNGSGNGSSHAGGRRSGGGQNFRRK